MRALGHLVIEYDIQRNSDNFSDLHDTDVVFICVPTDTVQGSCNVSNVETAIQQLSFINFNGIVVIKSTVIPGTTDVFLARYDLKICFVPEFLRAEHAINDFLTKHRRLIVGTNDVSVFYQLTALHQPLIDGAQMVSPSEAEITKYFSNVYNALRVVYGNIMFDVCEKMQANYDTVLNAVASRPNIATTDYLHAIPDKRGFSGHCLPKDVEAFKNFVRSLGFDYTLIDSILHDNHLLLSQNKQ
jgi:UDPglucose 6-dehydrogenase